MTKAGKARSYLWAGWVVLILSCLVIHAEVTIDRPAATSSDGLKVESFSFRSLGDLVSGTRYLITFRLRNVSDSPVTFHESYGVFVGARRDNDNIDFGHKAKGTTLQPGESVAVKAGNSFASGGTYHFWPAYHVNGHWGPYRWNEIVVQVVD